MKGQSTPKSKIHILSLTCSVIYPAIQKHFTSVQSALAPLLLSPVNHTCSIDTERCSVVLHSSCPHTELPSILLCLLDVALSLTEVGDPWSRLFWCRLLSFGDIGQWRFPPSLTFNWTTWCLWCLKCQKYIWKLNSSVSLQKSWCTNSRESTDLVASSLNVGTIVFLSTHAWQPCKSGQAVHACNSAGLKREL